MNLHSVDSKKGGFMYFFKLSRTAFALAIVTSFFSSMAFAESYPDKLFAINQMHFDASRSPRGIDWYLQSREAKVVIGSIAAYMGIDPRYVALATNAIPSARADGEETHYALPVASGYAYCSSRIGVQSLSPASGDKASVINASVYPEGLARIYTWTPVQNLFGGNSWVEGDLQITGILPQYLREFTQKGVCAPVTAQVGLINCKGNPCSPGYHGGSEKGEVARQAPNLLEGT